MSTSSKADDPSAPTIAARRRWIAVLAKATEPELEAAWADLPERPAYRLLRRPEIGLAMVRGRIGGSGAPFNLGEMTMTRATVRLEEPGRTPALGAGHVAGRRPRHAELAAVFDAMLQDAALGPVVAERVVAPLAAAQAASKAAVAARVAASKVEFFTLVRGE